ncbi:MAG TPA: hypothetical protein VNT30_08175 [Stellaceae bacterium]|nr:hypothetical protein [Stellaceae bacterium]
MQYLALVHFFLLVAVLSAGVRTHHLPRDAKVIAVFVLGWADLAITAQILSPFSALNVTAAYLPLSIAVGALASLGLRAVRPTCGVPLAEAYGVMPRRWAGLLMAFFLATGAVALIGSLLIAGTHYASNPDSIVYRFSRVYWYFGGGSLRHFSNSLDPRVVYYPVNGALAYLPFIHYRLSPLMFNAPSLLCWVMVGVTTWRFARELGGGRIAAVGTAWLVCLTPNILVQATSTNDEIIAASAVLAGLYFLHRWFKARQHFDFLLAVTGIALGAGTKLHLVFYWPIFLFIGAALIVHRYETGREIRRWLNRRGLAVLGVSTVLVATLFLTFMIYNYQATGQLMEGNLASQIVNSPFHVRVAIQNIVVYASQIVLAPFPDLIVSGDSGPRSAHYAAWSALLQPLFTWVDNGPDFVSASYRFTGIESLSATLFNEQTIFVGFIWVVALIAAAKLAARSSAQAVWGRFQLAGLFIWFVTWAGSTRYIEGISVYLSYGVVLAGPAFVFAWAPIRNVFLSRLRWSLLGLVIVAHGIITVNILANNSSRNLTYLLQAVKLPISRGFLVDQSVTDEIAQASTGVTDHTIAWGQPHWAFMAFTPRIKHYLAGVPPAAETAGLDFNTAMSLKMTMPGNPRDKTLHIYSFRKIPAYGFVPLHISHKASPGLTLIGTVQFALGPEWVFAAGDSIETKHPGHGDYIVLNFGEGVDATDPTRPTLNVIPYMYGMGPKDKFSYHYTLRIGDHPPVVSAWAGNPGVSLDTTGLTADNGRLLIEVRNDSADGEIDRVEVKLRSATPMTLE